ncbi:hypothetical protein M2263_000536 [Providencia alcalifaciens]|nr:hypothetical protein [Providencia alcalifaciens]
MWITSIYIERLLKKSQIDPSLDVFAKTKQIYTNLSDDDKKVMINLMRIIIADTASVISGTIDGSHMPDNIDGNFELIYKNESIHGDLQDYFLELVEMNNTF